MGFSKSFILKDKDSNKIYGWGSNNNGQLGIDDYNCQIVFSPKSLIFSEKKVIGNALGETHSLILNEDGSIESTGDNMYGQLGNGDNKERTVFQKIKFDFKVIFVGAGSNHSILITEFNDAYSFGNNSYGQLGLGDKVNRNEPTKINGKFREVVCGCFHNFSVDLHSNYFAFGSNRYKELFLDHKNDQSTPVQIKLDLTIKNIFAGNNISFLIDQKNTLYAIGYNQYGQLGNGKNRNIENLEEIKCPSGYFVHLECGSYHTLASTSTNKLYSFGRNDKGQLGLADTNNRSVPTETYLPLDDEKFDYFWCGVEQSFVFFSKSGHLYSCGNNGFGSLGIGVESVSNANRFRKIVTIDLYEEKKLIPLFQPHHIQQRRKKFHLLYFGHVSKWNLKCIWKRVPVEIIKEICKFI